MSSMLIEARAQSGFTENAIAELIQVQPDELLMIEENPSRVPCHRLHSLVAIYGSDFASRFNSIVYDALFQPQLHRGAFPRGRRLSLIGRSKTPLGKSVPELPESR